MTAKPDTGSALYRGTVYHRRRAERSHAFRLRLTMHYIDLAEAEAVIGRRFRRSDYFGDPATPLTVAVREKVLADAGVAVDGSIFLLTQLRGLGVSFNPISFYYCFDRDDRLAAILAEVTNTPWGERHAYVLTPDNAQNFQGSFEKRLHVSPFFGMDQTYEWSATTPTDRLEVRLDNIEHGVRVFEAGISMTRHPFRTRAAIGSGLRTLALIYGHAVALRLKGVRPVPHPGARTREATR